MRRLAFVLALAGLAAPAHATWWQATSAHFIIYSEDKPEALRAFATELERYDAAMRVFRMLQPETDSPNNKLTVYAVSDISAVRRLFGKHPGDIAGFYEPRAGGSVAFVPRTTGESGRGAFTPTTVLLHEYAHHFMYRNYPAAFPAWFVEGYAELNSTARFNSDGSVDLGLPAQHRSYGLFEMAQLPIATLLTANVPKLDNEQREVLYGRGWLLTHYLMFDHHRDGQLATYLKEVNEGKSSLDAAKDAFGDLTALNRELDKYKNGRMTYSRVPADRISVGPIEVKELSPGANAIMPVMLRSRRGVDEQQAQEVVKQARAAAAPYPNDPFVQRALAEAEIDTGNLDEADKAAERVLAADPQSVPAMVFRGRVAAARLVKAHSHDEAAWKAARHWYALANHADPDAPVPMMLFYRSFNVEGVKPTANSVDGLRTALALAPEGSGLRLMVARQDLLDGRTAEARAVLSPLAFDPHGGEMAEAAARVIAAIDAGKGRDAIKAWNAGSGEDDGN